MYHPSILKFLLLFETLSCKVIIGHQHLFCCIRAGELQSHWRKGAHVRLHYQVKVRQVPLEWERSQKENTVQ